MVNLNPEQEKASKITKGNLLIIASAGTGKTTTIVDRYVKLVNFKIPPSQIMMTTFTNKAAKDMIEKIKSKTNKISPFIGTMHSLFLRILRNHKDIVFEGKESTLITDSSEQKKILKTILLKLEIESNANSLKYFLAWISKYKNRAIFSEDLSWEGGIDDMKKTGQITELMDDELLVVDVSWRKSVNKVYKKYQEYLKENNLMDFDEVLLLTLKLFEENKEIKNLYQTNFKAIMVDEAQDLNVAQVKILELITNNNLCLIGDDCQNIYEWRGSSNDLVFKFQKNENEIILKENYRSTKPIIEAVNKVINTMNDKIKKELILTRGKGEKINIQILGNIFEEIELVVSEIEEKIESGIPPKNIAVLFRTKRYSKIIEKEMIKRQIPCHISKSIDFFNREEIKDIISFLKLKVNPKSLLDFERIISLTKGLGKVKIAKLLVFTRENKISPIETLERLEEFNFPKEISNALENLKRILQKKDTNPIKDFLEDLGYENYLRQKYNKNEATFENKLENIEILENLYHSLNNPKTTEFLDSLIEADKREKSKDAVTLSTIHSAKGLEWQHLYLIACNEKTLPFYQNQLSKSKRDSELRLFYVAISRAKDSLTITCSQDFRFFEPSSFLEIIK